MQRIRAFTIAAFSFAIGALLAACGSGSGSVPLTAPEQSRALSLSAGSYHPAFTVYLSDYQDHYPAPEPSAEPFGPLAVNTAATQFYFDDSRYAGVRLKNGAWTAFYDPVYTYKGGQIQAEGRFAFDAHNVLYAIAGGPGGPSITNQYFISHADASSGYVVTPLPLDADGYDLEADSTGRVFDLGTSTIYIIGNPSSSAPTVHHVTLPSSSTAYPCPYRIIEGTAHDIYVSTCQDFRHVYRYSRYFTLLATGYDADAMHINELAPDPNGGVWYTDDKGNHLGKMATTGKITEYPLPTNVHVTAIATARDGTIWISAYNAATRAVYIARVFETGTLTLYPMPAGVRPAVFMRGTYLTAAPASMIYWLDSNGDIVTVRSI